MTVLSRNSRVFTQIAVEPHARVTHRCMRMALTLDDDVAAILERFRKSRDANLKDLVNEALHRGLKDMTSRTKRRERLQTRSVALGRLRIADLDNIGEAYK